MSVILQLMSVTSRASDRHGGEMGNCYEKAKKVDELQQLKVVVPHRQIYGMTIPVSYIYVDNYFVFALTSHFL